MHRLQKLALEQGIYPKVFHPETDFWLKRPRAKKYPRIWLIEVARVLPSTALLDGIDINFNQCPPKEWLPNNLTWITHDILSEPPRKLCEKYDVIHVQLFITILRDGNPVPMLQNLMKMLKPGGYLQWCEWDVNTWEVLRVPSAPSQTNNELEELRDYVSTLGKTKFGPSFISSGYALIFLFPPYLLPQQRSLSPRVLPSYKLMM
ncbi:MAG: hypothetical protein Q9190_002300 [Brigantiaea leucoxantha]